MKKRSGTIGILVLLTVLGAGAALSWADGDNGREEQALKTAGISLVQAIEKAQMSVQGLAVSAELDDEMSPAVYLVEVVNDGRTHEVTVNPQNGRIIRSRLDKKDDDDHDGDYGKRIRD